MAQHTQLHLGLFTKFGPPAWAAQTDRTWGSDWPTGSFYIELAKRLEAAKFDFLFFEDTLSVSDVYGGTAELDLKHALYSPKHDPVALLPLLASYTEHMGFIASASTTFYPPFLLARLFSTIDSLAAGRVGWNVVTSMDDRAGQNFGFEGIPSAQERYASAAEFLEVVTALWNSWEEDAVVMDEVSGVYADASKVHRIDYVGNHHSSRGPLNTQRSPQGAPVIAQAGVSARGRELGAQFGEVLVATTAGGIQAMKSYREDMRRRAAEHGRNPDDCKVFFLVDILIADESGQTTTAINEAQFEHMLGSMSTFMNIDFSKFDLNEPIPQDLETEGFQSALEDLKRLGREGMTLRESILEAGLNTSDLELTGTPEEIADRLVEVMDEVGGDGVLFNASYNFTPTFLSDLTERIVPRMQELGAARTSYSGSLLRDLITAF